MIAVFIFQVIIEIIYVHAIIISGFSRKIIIIDIR